MASVLLDNIRVDFPIYATQRNLRTVILQRATGGLIRRQGKNQNRVVITALAGVSLTLKDGDRVGLIGHNGSGKSTLLKVLAGIYEPIEGRLVVDGTVTPLFDMMPGLDPEDNAYENIITAGLLLGMSRDEIEQRIPQIEELSELGEYLSLPVRTYSTGMVLRLGFSLVTSLEPGILLMDEGFGTGDARFAKRAQERLDEFVGRSRILVMASHSDTTIRSNCNKAVLLQEGRIIAIGSVDEVLDKYDEMVRNAVQKTSGGLSKGSANSSSSSGRLVEMLGSVQEYPDDQNKQFVIRRVAVVDENMHPSGRYGLDSAIFIEVDYAIKNPLKKVMVMVAISRDRNYIFQSHDTDLDDDLYLSSRQPGRYRASVQIPKRLLTAGAYKVFAKIAAGENDGYVEDARPNAVTFVLDEADQVGNTGIKGWSQRRGNLVIVEPTWKTSAITANEGSDGARFLQHSS
jgi:ABC-type polysaccharide/polyol phosphate transport system ATPase subunit